MMNIARLVAFVCVSLLLDSCSAFKEEIEDGPHHDSKTKPNFFGIFHRPPQKDEEKQSGFSLGGHFGSGLSGGLLGFQVQLNPLKKVHDVVDIAKQFIPRVPGGLGRPHARPEKPPAKPPKEDHWDSSEHKWKPKDSDNPKPEETKWEEIGEPEGNPKLEKPKWEKVEKPAEPVKPHPDSPNWDDIGEDHDYVTVAIEDIIQPRLKPRTRSKRFIESKIYHVPLLFSSNARPYKVNINPRNLLSKEEVRKKDDRQNYY